MPAPGNLIHEITSSTSTGNIAVQSVFGRRTFNTEFGTGGTDVFDYFISNRDANEWEIGTGHLSAATTLVRDTIVASSNADSIVNFSAGTKDVTNAIPAAFIVRTDGAQTLTNKTLTQPTITLKQSADPTPTAEGDIQWDTGDHQIKVGDGSGTQVFSPSTLSATDLRVMALKIADLEGDRIDLVNGIADPFKDEGDVDTGTSTGELYDATNDLYEIAPSTDYTNTGGTGDRQSIITESTNITFDGGTISNLIDGGLLNDTNDSVDMPVTAVSGQFFKFDFGAGNEKYITQFRIQKSGSEDSGTHNLDGSDDDTNWTTYGTISINGTPPRTGNTSGVPKAGHRYWRVIGTSGTFGNVFFQEWEFQIAAGGSTGVLDLRSNAFTASATPTTARLHLEIDPVDAITLNTDLIGHVSRDGGTTWTTATLTEVATLEDGTTVIYEDSDIDISGQPSGTSMKWRITTANNKELKIHRVLLEWA